MASHGDEPTPLKRVWHLHFADPSPWIDSGGNTNDSLTDRVVTNHDEAQLARLGTFTRRPFLVDDNGRLHSAVNRFFASARMRSRSAGTNRRYAYALRSWIAFLAGRREEWNEATEESILTFMNWRLYDPANPSRVTGASWAVDLAAIAVFYEWAVRHLKGPNLGFELGAAQHPDYPSRLGLTNPYSYRAASVRNADVRWLSPSAYRLWRNVGLLGLTVEGKERVRWRPRAQARDAAFVDGLYSSGLRLGEWSSMLLTELDAHDARLSGRRYATRVVSQAATKTQRRRTYWAGVEALNAVSVYQDTERAEAVRRGQEAGIYERIANAFIVEGEVPSKRLLILRPANGGALLRVSVDSLTPEDRLRLLVRDGESLAPAQVWLNEDGSPRSKRSWYAAFARANRRVEQAGISNLACHPHMLRHSFALRWYAVARLCWERKWGLDDDGVVEDFRYQFGDSWSLVQTMLGHTHVATTKRVYLEPFLSLNVNALVEYGRSDLDASILWSLLKEHPRVRTLSADEIATAP